MVRTVDVHNHLYPKDWLDYLAKRTQSPRMEQKGNTAALFSQNTHVAYIVSQGHVDPAARIKDLDRCGIDTQIISLTTPALEELPAEEGVPWAKRINNYFAEVCHKYPGRFYAYAALPYQDVDEALKELERAYRELNVKGICMFSNVNFKPVSSPEFLPIYAKAAEYGLPVFIHPTVAFTIDIMKKHKLFPGLYGFVLDTTMAVMSLIWQGVTEKYPRLNIIHAHLGGVVPYLVGRMEECWHVAQTVKPPIIEVDPLPHTPAFYYKRQVYPDTMSDYLPAMKCCLEFVGSSHLVMGTDYAHTIGNWETAVSYIKQAGLPEEETNNILGKNAVRLFKLD